MKKKTRQQSPLAPDPDLLSPRATAEVAEEDSRQAHAAVEAARAGGERRQLGSSASTVGQAAAAGGRASLGVEA
jgi:hypothetical protein